MPTLRRGLGVGWQLALVFVVSLAGLAGLIGWLQNVHIITANGMYKSIQVEPWISDPANAPLDPSNYHFFPLYGRLCALLDYLGILRGQAWRQLAYLNAFWASIGSVFVYAFAYRLSGSPAASAGATVFHAGTGFVLLLSPADVDRSLALLASRGVKASVLGEVVPEPVLTYCSPRSGQALQFPLQRAS